MAKRRKEQKTTADVELNTQMNENIDGVKSFLLSRIFSINNILLLAIVGFALYLRTVPAWDSIFLDGWTRVAADDAVFHVRLVENTVHNFPYRLWFDAFTHFPYGNHLHFGPLFTWIVAILAFIAEAIFGGGGIPTRHTIESVAALIPSIGGALIVLTTYFVAKEVFNDNRIGLLSAAILSVIPGQFFSRTMLGFADHHVLEILFSTLTMLFFIVALKKSQGFTFKDMSKRKLSSISGLVIYSLISGVMLSLFLLSWPGAPLFGGFLIGIFVMIQFIANHMANKSSDGLMLVSIITFILPPIIIAPIALSGVGQYGSMHMLSFIFGIIGFIVLHSLSIMMNKQKLKASHYPISLLIVGIVGFFGMMVATPSLFASITGPFRIFMPVGGALTVAEVHPMFFRGGVFTLSMAWGNFTTTLFISLIAFIVLGIKVATKWKSTETLLLVWSALMFFAMASQNRFAYFFAVNAAILSGYVGVKLMDLGGLKKTQQLFKEKVQKVSDLKAFVPNHLSVADVFMLGTVMLLVLSVSIIPSAQSSMQMSEWGTGVQPDWHESLLWMRENTPDPGIDFYGIYEAPPAGERFPFPDEAYSVMSWWDYGHIITYYAHRIPVANPFQAGIGGRLLDDGTRSPGASTFFTAQEESEAKYIAEDLGVRYVMIDSRMAFMDGIFMPIAIWSVGGDAEKAWEIFTDVITGPDGNPQQVPSLAYWNTMVTRLHLFDGSEVSLGEEISVEALSHFRLIHESPSVAGSIGATNVHHIKTFEKVEGATLRGNIEPNETVNLSIAIMSNQNRAFVHRQTEISDSNGNFEFVVPYSTEGPIYGETQFVVKPIGLYQIEVGGNITEVAVSELAVLEGHVIRVDK